MSHETDEIQPICPICFSSDLREFNTRPKAACRGCGSLERGRLAWMLMSRLGILRRGAHFLNLAPEPFMLRYASRIIGEGYTPVDFSPELFRNSPVPLTRFDLCAPPDDFEEASFDVVMHNHVLEHVRCDVAGAVANVERLLKPGGYHVFSIPIFMNRDSSEDLSFDLSHEERKRRFGQEDHVRLFGRDFVETFKAMGLWDRLIDLSALASTEELVRWGVPGDAFTHFGGHTIFAYCKN